VYSKTGVERTADSVQYRHSVIVMKKDKEREIQGNHNKNISVIIVFHAVA